MTAAQQPALRDDGSTQPLETQVYRDYYLKVEQTSTHERSHIPQLSSARSSGTGRHTDTPLHVLLSDPHDGDAPDLSDDELAQAPNVTTSPTLYDPKTPFSTGRKRDRYGNVLNTQAGFASSSQRKALPVTFGPRAAPPLTQLFEHTQADASSPLHPYEALIEPAFERPSPEGAIAQPETPSSPKSPTYRTAPQGALEPWTHYEPINPHSGGGVDPSGSPSASISLDEKHAETNRMLQGHSGRNAKGMRRTSVDQSDLDEQQSAGKRRDLRLVEFGIMGNAVQPYTPGRTAQRPILLSSNLRQPVLGEGLHPASVLESPTFRQAIYSDERARVLANPQESTALAQLVTDNISPNAMSLHAGTPSEGKFVGTQKLIGSTQAPLSSNSNAQNVMNNTRRDSQDSQTVCSRNSPTRRSANPGQTVPETSPPEAHSTDGCALQWYDDGMSKNSFYSALPGTGASTTARTCHRGCRSEHGQSILNSISRVTSMREAGSTKDVDVSTIVSNLSGPDLKCKDLQLESHDIVLGTDPSSTLVEDLNRTSKESPARCDPEGSRRCTGKSDNNINDAEQKKSLSSQGSLPARSRGNRAKLRTMRTYLRPDSSHLGDSPRSRPISRDRSISHPRSCTPAPAAPQHSEGDRTTLKRPMDFAPNMNVNSSTSMPGGVTNGHVAPFRVWACFKGFTRAPTFYPASCLSEEPHAKGTFRVHFDDGTDTSVEDHLLIALDLREGDLVKVDRQGLRNCVFVVQELKDRLTSPVRLQSPVCDIQGHQLVSLAMKGANGDSLELLEVSVGDIYVTSTMWRHFEKRAIALGQRSFQTRQELQSRASQWPRADVTDSDSPCKASNLLHKSRLFTSMAFALSFSATGISMRESVVSVAKAHGARLLDGGFEELFARGNEQGNKDQERSPSHAAWTGPLRIDGKHSGIGFVALVSDTHLRTAKYLQALALNVPCVSGRFIVDCVKAGNVLPWRRYLLPAGESIILDGAIRSRVLLGEIPQDPKVSNFKLFFEYRPNVLRGVSVLVIAGRGKAAEERGAFSFLAHAMGARSVKSVAGVEDAEQMLAAGDAPKLIICIDNGMIPEATRKLNLKRQEVAPDFSAVAASQGQESRLFHKEALVQSLILGELCDM